MTQTLGNYTPAGFPTINDPSALGKHATGEFSKIANAVSLLNQGLAADVANVATNTATLSTLGTAATKNVGTAIGNVVQMDGSDKLPAVDGSQLTNLPFPAAASKSDQQTGTSATKVVTPAHQQDHDGSAKAWVEVEGATGNILASFNIASVVRTGVGAYTITFTTAFSSVNWAAAVAAQSWAASYRAAAGTKTASSIQIQTFVTSPVSAIDVNFCLVAYGRQ